MKLPENAQVEFIDDWISHKDAAKLMHVNEKDLRVRDQHGNFVNFPELIRIRPVGRKIILLRTQVLEWRKQREFEALSVISPLQNKYDSGISYQEVAPELARLGGHKLLRALGVSKV